MDSKSRGAIALFASVGAAVVVVVASLAIYGTAEAGWLLAARYTARFAFLVFLAAFLGPAWLPGFDGARERDAILAFGGVHGIHLGALITYRAIAGTMPSASGLVIGGAGYALLGVMVVFIVLGKTSRAFQTGALHYLLVVFLLTYATKISTGNQHWAGVIGAAACGVAMVLRHVPRGILGRGRQRPAS